MSGIRGFDRAQREYDAQTDEQPEWAAGNEDDGCDEYDAPERALPVVTKSMIDEAFAKARARYAQIQYEKAG